MTPGCLCKKTPGALSCDELFPVGPDQLGLRDDVSRHGVLHLRLGRRLQIPEFRIQGVVMERDILSTFLQGDTVSILLRNPDFVTANTVAEAVQERFPEITLSATDPSRVEVRIPESRRTNPVGFIAELESIEVTPDPSGKVVIDSSSGVIIFGEQVRIGKVAADQGRR